MISLFKPCKTLGIKEFKAIKDRIHHLMLNPSDYLQRFFNLCAHEITTLPLVPVLDGKLEYHAHVWHENLNLFWTRYFPTSTATYNLKIYYKKTVSLHTCTTSFELPSCTRTLSPAYKFKTFNFGY